MFFLVAYNFIPSSFPWKIFCEKYIQSDPTGINRIVSYPPSWDLCLLLQISQLVEFQLISLRIRITDNLFLRSIYSKAWTNDSLERHSIWPYSFISHVNEQAPSSSNDFRSEIGIEWVYSIGFTNLLSFAEKYKFNSHSIKVI